MGAGESKSGRKPRTSEETCSHSGREGWLGVQRRGWIWGMFWKQGQQNSLMDYKWRVRGKRGRNHGGAEVYTLSTWQVVFPRTNPRPGVYAGLEA